MQGRNVEGRSVRGAPRKTLDLYLVRHAVAHKRDPERWPDDRLRPLTREGEEDFRAAARTLGRLRTEVGAVLSSPLTRAWQTAVILESEARWPAPGKLTELAPETSPSEILTALAEVVEPHGYKAVAIVGHRPSLHELASYALCGDPYGVKLKIGKGAVVVVRLEDGLRAGSGALRGLLPRGLLIPGA